MNTRIKMLLTGCAALALAVPLAGCNGATGASPRPTHAMPATASVRAAVRVATKPPASGTRSSAPATQDVRARLASVGITCPREPGWKGMDCTYKHDKLVVWSRNWPESAAARQRACDEGYINRGFTVATNGADLTIAAASTPASVIARLLDIRVEQYCP